MRSSGILLNLSCLPNRFGIGGFGREATDFAQFIKSSDSKWWQVLPLTTIGVGNSPYSGVSAFAGNFLYIDPQRLYEKGFISKEDLDKSVYHNSQYTVDYEWVIQAKRNVINSAYKYIAENNIDALNGYMMLNKKWLFDYSLFMALKDYHDQKPWYEWEENYKYKKRESISAFFDEHITDIGYYVCEQYLFDLQWKECKAEINKIGVNIIGDMPIYVSHDSVEVWSHPENFLLDEQLTPKVIAGVPPDYFSDKGQLWGNPIYDYKKMKEDGYSWFLYRIERMFELYDMLRIDHFRAFDRYWSVENGAKDAICGKWEKGAGIELFNLIKEKFPDAKIIAEDLGIIDEGVTQLRLEAGLPGMRVLQFGFDGYNSTHLPHNYTEDSIAYTGTHDNNTTFGWLYEIGANVREKLYDYIGASGEPQGGYDSPQVWGCIRAVLTSHAEIAIIPFQDICGWGGDTRMNIPGVPENNWRIRIDNNAIASARKDRLRRLNYLSARNT